MHVACAADSILARLESITQYKGAVKFADVGEAWTVCGICKQAYTGPFALLLAERYLEWAAECGLKLVQADALMHRAAELFHAERYEESEEDARHAGRLYDKPALGIESHMAECMIKRGKTHEALAIQTDLVGRARAEYGERDPVFLRIAYNLATTMSLMGDNAAAESILSTVYDTQKSVMAPSHKDTLTTGEALGNVLVRLRKHHEAAEVLRYVVAGTRRLMGDGSRRTRMVMSLLGVALFHTEKHEESERVYRALCDAHETRRPVNEAVKAELTEARIGLIQAIAGQGRLDESLSLIEGWGFDLRSPTGPFAPIVAVIRASTDTPSQAPPSSQVPRCEGAGCTRPASALCTRCRSARYCSKECQRKDWKIHKPLCSGSSTGP